MYRTIDSKKQKQKQKQNKKKQGVPLMPELSESRSGLCCWTNTPSPVWGPSELEALGFFQIPLIFKNYHLIVSTSTFSKGIFSGELHYYHSEFSHLSTFQAEKAMAPYSITLAWKTPWTEEPGRLQSMGWLRVGHDWATSLSLFTFMHWRRKWQPTPVFLPGEFQGWESLMGCHLWGRTESDTTEVT